jgi:hypothetical protein
MKISCYQNMVKFASSKPAGVAGAARLSKFITTIPTASRQPGFAGSGQKGA